MVNWNDISTIPDFLLKFKCKQIEERLKRIDKEIVDIVLSIHA
jgi:hypothetical protein